VQEPADKQQHDRDFSELYKAHLRDVYSYAYYRIGNHHDAEDITEQTFLQAYRHFERAQRESDGRPLRPWLIRIAHNLAANYYRDRSRRPGGGGRRPIPVRTPARAVPLAAARLLQALGHDHRGSLGRLDSI
jgi:DNA-directed RNA polymerase specialized sigma24 family protein